MSKFIWAMMLVLASTIWINVSRESFRIGDNGFGFAQLGVSVVIAVLAAVNFKEGVDEIIKKKVGK